MSGQEAEDGLKSLAQRSPSSTVDGLKQSRHFDPKSKSMGGMIANLDDGDGQLDPDAVVSALRSHAKVNRSNANLKKSIAALAALYVVTILLMLGTSTAGALLAKDTETDSESGIQTTKEGVAVKTEVANYYADIMDLPKFGLDQLDHLESFSLSTAAGRVNFKAAGFMSASETKLTLFTTANAKIELDTAADTAEITFAGGAKEQAIVRAGQSASGRRLMSEAEEQSATCMGNGACLYASVPELMGQNSAPGRQLSAKENGFSYATLSTNNLGSMEALSSLIATIGGGEEYYAGTAHAFNVPIKFSKSKDEGLRLSVEVEGQIHLFANVGGDDVAFSFDESGLIKCADGNNALSNDALAELLSGNGEVYVTIDEKYDGVSDNGFMMPTPTLEDCAKAPTNIVDVNTADTTGRRLLSTNGEEGEFRNAGHRQMSFYRDYMRHMAATPSLQHHVEFAEHSGLNSDGRKLLAVGRDTALIFGEMSADVYDGGCDGKNYGSNWVFESPSGITKNNAFFNHFVRTVNNKKECAFVFRGSNDISDWWSNIKGVFASWRKVPNSNQNAHQGFVQEFEKTKSYIDDQGCRSYYFSGHSLGGAMASIADVCYGGTSITFSAPQTFQNKLKTTDYRLFHESDPVSGNAFGFLRSFSHSGGDPSKQITCTRWNWWHTKCKGRWEVRNVGPQDNSGTWDTDFGAHNVDKVKSYN